MWGLLSLDKVHHRVLCVVKAFAEIGQELELEESNAPQAGEVEDDETMSELAAQLLLLEE